MNRSSLRATALITLLFPVVAFARQPVDVSIFDRTAGYELPIYWHAGERYVAGEPGHRYEVRIRNQDAGRVLAVSSVDGVNVISGETAAAGQAGYVLDPWSRVEIEGWRKNLDEVAAFYFTSLPDSYAARTGRPDNVGVIGVAIFRERVPYPVLLRQESEASANATAPAPEAEARADSAKASQLPDRLGTGHGERVDSQVTYTEFERATDSPECVIRVFYDSRRNLVAQGVIPSRRYARNTPDPFPGGFVPDP
mgnify:FL=1